MAAIQISKGLGAHVLAATRTPEQAAFAVENGADSVIDVSGSDIRDTLRTQVHAATGGVGADVVIDPLGGDFFGAALRAMAWCGRLVIRWLCRWRDTERQSQLPSCQEYQRERSAVE